MTIDEVKQAIAAHEQVLQSLPQHIDTPKRWEHLGAIAALKTRLDEYLITEVEESLGCHPSSFAADRSSEM